MAVGPNFVGPTTKAPTAPPSIGWSASSLVPKASIAAVTPPAATAAQGQTDLSQYDLTDADFGMTPNLRAAAVPTTPLEQLLASMFPDAAEGFNPFMDPAQRGGQATPSLLNTILGNLSLQSPAASTMAVPVGFNPQLQAPNIPGAPAFLQNAFAGLQQPTMVVPTQGANPLNSLAAVSALAAEQRVQAAEQEKARKQAEADFFSQQQEQQKAKAMTAQRQRQRLGFAPSGVNSGWATNPTFY